MLTSPTAGVVILAAGGRRSPRNLRVNSTRVVQEAELLRAANIKVFDRFNVRNEVTFDVLDNIGAASSTGLAEATALLTQRQVLAGTVTFVCADNAGGTFVRYLANAIVQQASAEHLGIMITYSYRIIGGAMTQSAPITGVR